MVLPWSLKEWVWRKNSAEVSQSGWGLVSRCWYESVRPVWLEFDWAEPESGLKLRVWLDYRQPIRSQETQGIYGYHIA